MNKKTMPYVAPVLFFLLLLVDGQISRLFGNVLQNRVMAISSILLIALIPATMKLSRRYLVILMLILGILMDSYYLGVLGINTLMLPLMTFYAYGSREVINTNIFTELFGLIILITVYHSALALLEALFGLAKVSVIEFIAQILGPTLILNIIFFFVLIVPFRRLFRIR
ncbi:rod shape-determining protein MreD [Pilibacter termitis]|uniref:Rod shape-determining protein MreD n=1 Tax=Pilibacter termitis TaxID=263852 RepID=A0A1T4LK34_9ENTE|nr:rod shape-determining protein MreD [Pilibacter termitis]SJZ55099.1 rod shape-determining protein MreD [Pilibacter termitis]